jgi:uncharacterized damage-inducible protein DinB
VDALQLQEQLDEVRVQLLEALAPLPDEALLAGGATGDWSLADVLAHFVNWEAEMVTALNKIDQGKRPARLLEALADRDAYNEARVAETHGRDLDRVFDDLQGVRAQLEEWLDLFTTQQLEEPGYYSWAGGRPLWRFIADTSFEHERKHLPAIERFAATWLVENDDEGGAGTIEVSENGNQV